MSVRLLWGVLMLGLGLCSLPAEGHTRLISSAPAAGQVLSRPPAHLSLQFSAPIEATFSQVELSRKMEPGHENKAGPAKPDQAWQALKISVDGKTIHADLPTLLPAIYRIRWRVLARDGHIQRGQFSFQVR